MLFALLARSRRVSRRHAVQFLHGPKRTSALDAAAQVLKKAGKPMRSQDLIEAMATQGLWKSPGGKTPHATLYAAMLREITARGKDARFKKVDRGQFEFAG